MSDVPPVSSATEPDSDVPADVHSSATWPESILPTDLCCHTTVAPEPDAGRPTVLRRGAVQASHGTSRRHEHGDPGNHSSYAKPAHGTTADGRTGEY